MAWVLVAVASTYAQAAQPSPAAEVAAPAGPSTTAGDAASITGRERIRDGVLFDPFTALNPPGSKASAPAVASPVARPPATSVAKPAAPPPSVAPAPPNAPSLPFVALGSINGADVTGGQTTVFVQQQGGPVLVVKTGDQIGGVYRVETISSDAIEFIHLPTRQKQTLHLSR